MRLARIAMPWENSAVRVERALSEREVDFLQLDCEWPRSWQCGQGLPDDPFSKWSTSFFAQMRHVHRSLFLRPELRVVTNAGGGNVVGCMELLAQFLVEHGSSDMPIAAIRGENLLSSIEWLPTDIALSERPLLAARVQLGSEPLVASLSEGARIVVTGAYERSAPFMAAAIYHGLCEPSDYARLARFAAASQFENCITESHRGDDVSVEDSASTQLARVKCLGTVHHAGLVCDYSGLKLDPVPGGSCQIDRVTGSAASPDWNVHMTADLGFSATALAEAAGFTKLREFAIANFDESCLSFSELEDVSSESRLLKVSYRSLSMAPCTVFLAELISWLDNNAGFRLAEPYPSILRHTEPLETQIDSEQVTLAVDTRPAAEWL